MRTLTAFFLGLALCGVLSPAGAAPPKGDHAEAEGDEKDVGRTVELGGLVFPVFSEDGRLRNYLFVNARMTVAPGKDPWKYREQAHFIRDAVLRAAHRTSFGSAKDTAKLDEKIAAKECLKAANEAVGETGALVEMTFTQIASQSNG
jgi:hypothetical protein